MSEMMRNDDELSRAQLMLKRAYVLTSYGFYKEALEACEEAAALSDDELVPRTIYGAILSASGRPMEAMKHLNKIHRANRRALLPALYLAEACFLAGRGRRAWRILDGLDQQMLAESPYADFAAQLRQAWGELEELDQLPGLLVVPFEEDSAA